ncbi:unnamed protein product [Nezara viridula]|uniref:Major facilitator superfamily (MFS) profile domain-containing protein n=1 Tax=Nezara viridula TaxID=85310 RepID=A0A9P0HQJ0_NEZVI|nr:unnamed protein product [Nezara viridula]
MMKTGSGSRVDLESLKALVTQPGKPIVIDRVAKEGSAKLLPGVGAALMANLGTINTGMAFGFSAVAIPQLEAPDSLIPIDKDQASWVASLAAVTTPIGCILSGWMMDGIGRKKSLIVTQIPTIIGWLLIAYADSLAMIYAGRLLVGLGSGMVGAPARVYTAEATQPHLRGMLAAMASVGVSLGVLIEYGVGAVFDWKRVALISSTVPAISLIGCFLIPESPQWLVSVGKEAKGRAALSKLRGPTCDIDYEANQMINFALKNNLHKPSTEEILRGLIQPAALKPFFILTLYFLIYQFSGVNSVTFYAVEVFQDSGATWDKYFATVMLGVVRLVITLFSCVGCGVSLITLGGYMWMGDKWAKEGIEPIATWIPIFAIFLFTAASVLGYLVVPWVMVGEVYPTQVRGIIGGLTTCGCHFFIFLVVKSYPLFQSLFTKHGTWILYGCISSFGTIFFYFFLPETKGRTLQEIEDYFSGRRKNLGKPNPPSQNPSFIQIQKGNVLP